jgi:hypothetical protein
MVVANAARNAKDRSMAKDQQRLELAGAAESAAAFDRAIADYYGLTGDPVGVLKSALARDPLLRWAPSRSRRFTWSEAFAATIPRS